MRHCENAGRSGKALAPMALRRSQPRAAGATWTQLRTRVRMAPEEMAEAISRAFR